MEFAFFLPEGTPSVSKCNFSCFFSTTTLLAHRISASTYKIRSTQQGTYKFKADWHLICVWQTEKPIKLGYRGKKMNDFENNEKSDKEPRPGRGSAGSVEYRQRLLHKLNTLIGVLESAIGKISRNLSAPDANQERLEKIRNNLENTLQICRRAKATLESKMDEKKLSNGETLKTKKNQSLAFRSYVELSSIAEFRKFKNMDPISSHEIKDVDLDELERKLQELE